MDINITPGTLLLQFLFYNSPVTVSLKFFISLLLTNERKEYCGITLHAKMYLFTQSKNYIQLYHSIVTDKNEFQGCWAMFGISF